MDCQEARQVSWLETRQVRFKSRLCSIGRLAEINMFMQNISLLKMLIHQMWGKCSIGKQSPVLMNMWMLLNRNISINSWAVYFTALSLSVHSTFFVLPNLKLSFWSLHLPCFYHFGNLCCSLEHDCFSFFQLCYFSFLLYPLLPVIWRHNSHCFPFQTSPRGN